jgi:hypothetical protein
MEHTAPAEATATAARASAAAAAAAAARLCQIVVKSLPEFIHRVDNLLHAREYSDS